MSTTRTALARQYRPRRFGEVAMQEHVSRTLRTAVARGRTAHAYLFCGPRGVGKTTVARVLAMALNCPRRGEDGEPCGECESCERIWAGRTSLDVVEIDAASNRGVDDARDLRERAMYAPTDEHRYKVYIIDEAHMLTREAWNALLKILEEPPPRVIFVFATTEPQKIQQVASPILSRCQRFDFRRITVAGIVERLRQVVEAEGIEVAEDVLLPLARRAEGGMRDALSLLDQVLAFADGAPTAEDVRRILGLVDEELFLELFEILAAREHGRVFGFVQRLLDEGYDLGEFYRGLADALRTLLVIRFDGADAAEVREDLRAAFAERAERFGTGDLLRMLARVAELDTEGAFRKSGNPRLLLEALLLRFAHLERTVELEDLIRAAGSGGGPGGPGGPEGRRGPETASTVAMVRDAGGAAPYKAEARAGDRGGADSDVAIAAGAGGGARGVSRTEAVGADAAFRAVLAPGGGLPAGLGMLLKPGRIVEESEDRLRLELPPGPGLEKLTGEPAARAALESALRRRLSRDVSLEIAGSGASGGTAGAEEGTTPPRLTPDRVKNDRLQRLTEEEPLLREAVQEWDLELLD